MLTKSDGKTAVYLVKLILEELRLIRSEMKDEVRKLASAIKVSTIHQYNNEQSENTGTKLDLKETLVETIVKQEHVSDLNGGPFVFGNGVMEVAETTHCTGAGNNKVSFCEDKPTEVIKKTVSVEPESGLEDISNDLGLTPQSSQNIDRNASQSAHQHLKDSESSSMINNSTLPVQDERISEIKVQIDKTAENVVTNVSNVMLQNTIENSKKKEIKMNYAETLKKQILLQHPQKTHSCGFCNKTFKSTYYLVSHVRMHTGIKPFKCQVCCKQFSRKENLNKHNKCHHKFNIPIMQHRKKYKKVPNVANLSTAIRPFQYTCPFCKISFKHIGHCLRHMKLHTDEKEAIQDTFK